MPPFLRGQQVAREEPTGCSRRQTADEDVATATMCTGIFEIIAPQSNTSRYVLQPLFNVERDDEHSGQSVCNELALPQVSVDCPCLPALSAFSAPFLISSRSPSPSCSRPTTDVDLPRADSTLLPRVGQESFLDARNQVSSLHSRFAGRFVPHFDSYLWFLCSSAFLASLPACPAECNEIRILGNDFSERFGVAFGDQAVSASAPKRAVLCSGQRPSGRRGHRHCGHHGQRGFRSGVVDVELRGQKRRILVHGPRWQRNGGHEYM